MYGYNNKPIHHLAHNYAGNAVALRCFSDDAVTRPCYPCNKINCCIAQQIVQIQYTYLVIWLSFLVPIWRIGWEHLSVMHLITWQLALLTPSAWLASLSLSLSLSVSPNKHNNINYHCYYWLVVNTHNDKQNWNNRYLLALLFSLPLAFARVHNHRSMT